MSAIASKGWFRCCFLVVANCIHWLNEANRFAVFQILDSSHIEKQLHLTRNFIVLEPVT